MPGTSCRGSWLGRKVSDTKPIRCGWHQGFRTSPFSYDKPGTGTGSGVRPHKASGLICVCGFHLPGQMIAVRLAWRCVGCRDTRILVALHASCFIRRPMCREHAASRSSAKQNLVEASGHDGEQGRPYGTQAESTAPTARPAALRCAPATSHTGLTKPFRGAGHSDRGSSACKS
jgi:hypothetical protein